MGLLILLPRAAILWGIKKLGRHLGGGGSAWTPPCLPALGIQKNAKALQHMLKHPLLYSSSRPKLDTLQKTYVPKEKRVNLHVTEYTDTPPSRPPQGQR